jgi:hypothetical protein
MIPDLSICVQINDKNSIPNIYVCNNDKKYKYVKYDNDNDNVDVIDDNIFNSLLYLASGKETKKLKSTRKKNKDNVRKTRKKKTNKL